MLPANMKTLDIQFFPHIFDNVFSHAVSDGATLLKLRSANRAMREKVDAELWRHVRATDSGIRDSRGLVLGNIPPPTKMQRRYILDVVATGPTPEIQTHEPGVVRLLQYLIHLLGGSSYKFHHADDPQAPEKQFRHRDVRATMSKRSHNSLIWTYGYGYINISSIYWRLRSAESISISAHEISLDINIITTVV